MTRLYVDGPTLIRAVEAATRNLERHVEEVDSLNVFPVPDGDTGSNMLATMRAALAEARALPDGRRDLDSVAEALSRGALAGARGNSGVILSQIIRGMTHGADGRRRASGVEFAQGLRKGSEVAYRSVLTPVEGTILTVIRDAADAAEAAAGRQPHVEAVLAEVIEAAASSVQRTPMLLPVLEDAGVVDSGGQGLFRVLEGMLQLEGERAGEGPPGPARSQSVAAPPTSETAPATAAAAAERPAAGHLHGGQPGSGQHGYETQYLLTSPTGDIDVDALRRSIDALGDSVIVAGDARLARVHVHGERPDLAIAAGLPYGRLSRVEVLDLDDQVAHNPAHLERTAETLTEASTTGPAHEATAAVPPAGLALVAVTGADGLAAVLGSLGARIVRPGHGTRPSVGEISEAILAAAAEGVLLLPNDRDALLAARQAAELAPAVRVEVIPTRNVAEGIAAAVAFDPAASLEENRTRMAAEAASVRSFRVITAARDSIVDGLNVRAGQILALDADRHLLASGADVEAVTIKALTTYEDFELITLYCGHSETPGRQKALCERIELAGFGAEVELVEGGQPYDHLLVAVE